MTNIPIQTQYEQAHQRFPLPLFDRLRRPFIFRLNPSLICCNGKKISRDPKFTSATRTALLLLQLLCASTSPSIARTTQLPEQSVDLDKAQLNTVKPALLYVSAPHILTLSFTLPPNHPTCLRQTAPRSPKRPVKLPTRAKVNLLRLPLATTQWKTLSLRKRAVLKM